MRRIGPVRRAAHFGVFDVDFDSRELRKQGIKLKLQDQPFQILEILLERPGEVVSRETLRQHIWPADTFVDFDHGLYNAVKRLREALGDTADKPRFVETLSRRGYRFIGQVSVDRNGAAVVPQTQPTNGAAAGVKTFPQRAYRLIFPAHAGQSHEVRFVSTPPTVGRKLTAIGFLLFLCVAATWWLIHPVSVAPALQEIPLTGTAGVELMPAFSPDGNQVAFKSYPESGTAGIYTALVGGEKLLQLTSGDDDCCPTWSPDGRYVAFTRTSEHHSSIYIIPALGGTARLVHVRTDSHHPADGALSWSPDGALLAFSECNAEDRCEVSVLSLADYTTRAVSSPPTGYQDRSPAFSPDGRAVAFVRSFGLTSFLSGDLVVARLRSGKTRRLTFDNRFIWGSPAWTPDSQEIVFSSDRAGLATLWRISTSGERLRLVEGVGPVSTEPSMSLREGRLAYVHRVGTQSLWLLNLRDRNHPSGPPLRIVASKASNALPQFAPDGKRVAFESQRSGYDEVWAANTDGSDPVQLTSLAAYSGTPHWSPDSRSVVFDFRARLNSDIYVVSVPPGVPRLVPTFADADNVVPSRSRDGQSIYFASRRGKQDFQVWRVALKGGTPVQITQRGGYAPVESADGSIYYSKGMDQPAIWKVSVDGGQEVLALDPPGLTHYANWAPTHNGIYYLDSKSYPHNTIVFFDFSTHKILPVWTMEKEIYIGLAVSPDEKSIVYSQNDQDESNIQIVKNFR
ncbi:MAG TPA: winged helix-turn-helix domain-containing protein [Terriglobales bacterium]|nr:winged helix-turn-helix domain-containing protein [Terriglobales bacterium]